MTKTRTAAPKTVTIFAGMMALAVMMSPLAAHADFNVSNDMITTLGGLSTAPTAEASDSNISALQAKVNALKAEMNATNNPVKAAQLAAVASALQDIIARLQAGFIITDYKVKTNESTLETTVAISFADETDNIVMLAIRIPPVDDYMGDSSGATDDYGNDGTSGSSSGGSGGADMLTQILQQLGSQMGGGQNRLSSIQNTLNSMISNNGATSPVESMLSGAVKDAVNSAMQCNADGSKVAGNGTAVYDISAGKVYMPNGEVLEAHSGLGNMMDNPAFVNQRGQGPTPPGVYSLSMRESLFHGTEAIRMTPGSGTQMYGRDGILAHPPLRRGSIGSSGCIAFADYSKFLNAFKRGEVQQIVVVSSVSDANNKCTPPVYNTPSPSGSGS
ncbi:MAG: DUF2778 domain-containing protein [Blastochloris viridis]|uniref:DUF2778 domain-containing protein n=1 Tax=Blastochloris viridis TaxID=1079 RepID=A0A6N4R899_BLAVI|nr:MAG: DUF2778 domain-containing protein [Blastochloris viridis]